MNPQFKFVNTPNAAQVLVGICISVFASAVLLAVAASSASASGLSCKVQPAGLKLCGAQTDNYKACFNADDAPDSRTWMPFYLVQALGATYAPNRGQNQFTRRIVVHKVRGLSTAPTRGYLAIRALTGNVDFLQYRIGPPSTLFGPFFQLHDKAALETARVRFTVTLRNSSGGTMATTAISYRYEPAFANADPSSPEYNGPGGRWWVVKLKTRTNVELGAPGC